MSQRLVIDGKALVDPHFSGIGHYTMSLLQALDEILVDEPDVDVRLAVPMRQVANLARFRLRRIRPLAVPMSYARLRRLIEQGRLPKMDRICGRATYFFPNYVRWPLASSPSITAVHDLSFDKVPDTVDGPNALFLRREVRKSVEMSDLVTALTSTMADDIAEHYLIARAKVHIVGCGTDRRRFYK
ncbi:MAG: glycosyltransferase, partial [Acidimicrobiia bacterium]|nr:glycosyltransferase [Acidimicrobiia bacterium]